MSTKSHVGQPYELDEDQRVVFLGDAMERQMEGDRSRSPAGFPAAAVEVANITSDAQATRLFVAIGQRVIP